MLRGLTIAFFLTTWGFLGPAVASAVTLSEAERAYQAENFAVAAVGFFSVMSKDSEVANRQRAEFYLAKSLDELGFAIPALYYYKGIFQAGRSHSFYLQAVGEVVSLAADLRDDFVIPSILNSHFDAESFEKLDPLKINTINYMIGALSYRQGKYDDSAAFLSAISKNAPVSLKARYLLGVIKVRKNDNAGALVLWQAILDETNGDQTVDPERARLRQMALLAVARAHYALGNFQKALEFYKKVPRFAPDWFDAMFESGWAYFQIEDYGRALGQVESVLSPYFEKHFRPESYVLAATIYYSNCQFDRTRRTLADFLLYYEPALEQLKAYIASGRKESDFYNDMVASSPTVPIEALRQVRRNGRVLNLHRIVAETIREQNLLSSADNASSGVFRSGAELQDELKQLLSEQREVFTNLAGALVLKGLKNEAEALNLFMNQARLVKFETANSEKEILESGGDITAKKRKRLPRPDIESDQIQMWNFHGEYWANEVGYYVHGIRKECAEANP